jgi:hypothetical protein
VAKDLVKWIRNGEFSTDEFHSLRIGEAMLQEGIFKAVRAEVKSFEPNEFYRFAQHWNGKVTEDKVTWHKKF